MQTTLRRQIALAGTGLHSGRPARLAILPAGADHGIRFRRTDLSGRDGLIPAMWDAVSDTTLNTRIANPAGVSVSTIEHLMAALSGCGVHNAVIEIDGPEVPIMDGSARKFVAEIRRAGLQLLDAPLRALRVRRTVSVGMGTAWAALEPCDRLEIGFEIDFPDAAIGHQRRHFVAEGDAFAEELADSRTFCRRADIEAMQARGLALGGTLENAVVVDGETVLNPEGFRHADECVRHKMLDAMGDLALAGAPLIGRYTGVRAGHSLNNRLLRELFVVEGAVELVTTTAAAGAAEALPLAV
ncbi:MAG: UDP-3-O-acyl-N-acetylglucosamine deacetylase [Alphaproteobacteria bacterium]|nr:MAG: UDP-3-O-acyl-N-acetylglucosamine deacetylase [Alphaproteobacteria bacterium]